MSKSHTVIRSRIKQQRKQLPAHDQQLAALNACQLLKRQRCFINSQHIAVYLPMNGELSPMPLIDLARKHAKQIYLPVLMPFLSNRLWFAPWQPDTEMKANRFGIPEPVFNGRYLIPARQLDLVITPLVAFDSQCHRIGMGGGYYDRTFSFLRFRQYWHTPKLIGLAYEFQKIKRINAQPWDVPLHAVVSHDQIYKRSR